MSPNAPRRKGRPPNFVKDEKGHPVIGLSSLPVRNKAGELLRYRYYATSTKPRVYFGYDAKEAIAEFRRWQSKNKDERVLLEYPLAGDALRMTNAKRKKLGMQPYPVTEAPIRNSIPESTFWQKVAEVFSTDEGRRKAAKLTGYSLIRKLDQPDEFARSLSLREVGQLCYGKRDDDGKRLSGTDTNDDQKTWKYWQEFCKAVKVANLNDVTRDKIESYRRYVVSLKLAPRTVTNRYNAIGQVLSTARDRRENHTDVIDKVRDSFRVICRKKAPKVPTGIPTPIDVDDFAAMLKVADKKWTAILYLMMNCGLHPGELTGLHLDDVDLRKRWLWDHRNKNVEQRCSMLWKETIDAIRAYMKEYKPDDTFLFVNLAGKRHPTGDFGIAFKSKVRKPANVSRVTLEWFRDSGTNAASMRGVDSDKVRIWLGHKRGELDKYDPRHPSKTQPVVDAIYAEYKIGDVA